MLTYEELKKNDRKFVSLTSLTPEEFEYVLPAFERAYRRVFPETKTKTGQKRERKPGGGRKGALASIEQKLLFALVYQKSYPVQSIMGELFGISQSQANEWIHTLLPILGTHRNATRKSSRKVSKVKKMRRMPSLTVRKGGVRDPKTPKNRLSTIVARRKSIVKRT